jgi:hypothetical protein
MTKSDFITQDMLDKCQKLAKKVMTTGDAIADLYETCGLAVIYNPKKLSFEIMDMEIYQKIVKYYYDSLEKEGFMTITKKIGDN